MFYHHLKKLTPILVILLVLLQLISPMLHQHPADSSLEKVQGFHLHFDDYGFTDSNKNADKVPTLSVQKHTPQVIGVPVGNETKQPLLPMLTLVCLYFILLFNGLILKPIFFSPEINIQRRKNPRFTSTQLRAPPL
ncbi:MAG: hypothetical protein WBP13_03395 [Methylophilaceae bacterium]